MLSFTQIVTEVVEVPKYDPAVFWDYRRSGLLVEDSFDKVLSAAEDVPSVPIRAIRIKRGDLRYPATSLGIEKSRLGSLPRFTETMLCVLLESLITRQGNGQPGTLLTNSSSTLFFTVSGLTSVKWVQEEQEWQIGFVERKVWSSRNDWWPAGTRVVFLD